jgi:Cdc6-like AAA superfamily ATPase
MDQQIAFAAKEEILKNIIRMHARILVTGWEGTGKTVTALKATRELWNVYYYTESGVDIQSIISRHNDSATVLHNLKDFDSVKSEQPLLIIDDLNNMSKDTLYVIIRMLSENRQDRKIVLISRTLMDADILLSKIDAVVRLKQDTAEMLFSSLKNIDNL